MVVKNTGAFFRKRQMARHFALIFLLLTGSMTVSAADQSDYHGLWWNEDRSGIFELRTAPDGIEGITRWGAKPDTDKNNPDPLLRNRDLKDIIFLWGFDYEPKKNRWRGGKVYDPNNGKTYSAKMELEKDGAILKMRGYIGISLLGRTARFERVSETDMPANFILEASSQ